jgi:rifampicin phosphotransferase
VRPGGPGRVPRTLHGPARIIRGEGDLSKLRPGDILVCPAISPVWSVLFPAIGALVTDAGGVLSHPAIMAREFGIPAVVATGNATSLLQDAQVVTVDGSRGRIPVNQQTTGFREGHDGRAGFRHYG